MVATPNICLDPPANQRDIPRLTLRPGQVTGLLDQLHRFWQRFAPLFQRREQRELGLTYLQGRLMDGDKRYTQPMARRLGVNNVRTLQNFVGASPWDDLAVLEKHQQAVQETLADAEALVIIDGTGFPRKGTESAGVARQYCNETGKVDNCQVGIFLAYASPRGYSLLDRRLYLPEEWFSPAYAAHRQRCGIPKNLTYRTHPELAWEMIAEVHGRGAVTFQWVLGDEEFGRDTNLLDRVAGLGKWYFMEVPVNTRVWRDRPATVVPAWQGRGRKPTRERLAEGAPIAQTVTEVKAGLAPEAWQRYTLHEGSKGPLVADIACVRVVVVRDDLPGPDVWLVIRQNVATGETKYFLSNAPQDTSPAKLAWLSAARWPVEQAIEDCKDELKLNQYAMRSWRGWYHHVTLVMIAHLFLVTVQQTLKADAPALTVSQARLLLQAVLPKPVFDAQAALAVLRQVQRANHAAYLSHRRKTLQKLGVT
jgi:SRSO17 transposase